MGYRNHEHCLYHIKQAKESVMTLTFDVLDLEFEENCQFDYIKVCILSHLQHIYKPPHRATAHKS